MGSLYGPEPYSSMEQVFSLSVDFQIYLRMDSLHIVTKLLQNRFRDE